jgi:phosphoglycerol transferase
MGDEYIYSTQARNLPFAEHSYSNYLFSWFMGFTKYCGPEFYTCTKAINSVFFLATVALVLLIALRLLSFWQSIFVASIAALSPIAIPVSYFMPESMYFFMMTLAIWVALTISTKPNWWIWSSLGLVVGLASLVKPHAIFVAPAFLMFALFIQRNNGINLKKYSFFKSVLSYGLGFALGKFALGFVFAGSSGLRLFGGYGSPVEALTSAANREIGNSVP